MAQVTKERIIGPKCVLRVIGPRIIMWRILLLTFVLLSSFAIFDAPFSFLFFQLGFFSSLFSFLLVIFLCLHIFAFSRVSSVLFFWAPELDCLWSWKDFFYICLQCGGCSLIRVTKEFIRLKRGQLVDNFISMKG